MTAFLSIFFLVLSAFLAIFLFHMEKRLRSIEKLFHKFVPTEYLSLVEKSADALLEGNEFVEKEMTILFLDLRNFVAFSQARGKVATHEHLQAFYQTVSVCIRKHRGFIDKYMGDGLMAVFPTHPDDAVKASFLLLRELKEISFGIGIHRGSVQISCLGDGERSALTVISQTVNLAARLEQMTKEVRTPILLSEETYHYLGPFLRKRFVSCGSHPVKGYPTRLTLYGVNSLLDLAA